MKDRIDNLLLCSKLYRVLKFARVFSDAITVFYGLQRTVLILSASRLSSLSFQNRPRYSQILQFYHKWQSL